MGEDFWTSNVYIISPFTAVKDGIKNILQKRLKSIGIPKELLKGWLRESVGTVHTFQGKEADIVYFVTGTDEKVMVQLTGPVQSRI